MLGERAAYDALVPIILRALLFVFCIFVMTLNVKNQQLVNVLQQEESFQEIPHKEEHTMVSMSIKRSLWDPTFDRRRTARSAAGKVMS